MLWQMVMKSQLAYDLISLIFMCKELNHGMLEWLTRDPGEQEAESRSDSMIVRF